MNKKETINQLKTTVKEKELLKILVLKLQFGFIENLETQTGFENNLETKYNRSIPYKIDADKSYFGL